MRHTFIASRTGFLCLLLLTCGGSLARAQVATLTAVVPVKSAGGVTASAPLTIVVQRSATDAERNELVAAVSVELAQPSNGARK
jgi:hypothetical protein